jgi:O-antigen/teichoic acid export membrane protein
VAWWRGPALDGLIAATVICRIGANLPVFLACRRHIPLQSLPRFRKSLAAPLFRYGGWVTVTAIIGPILVSVDRFLIGSQMGMSAVAHCTVPYNFVTKFQILPASLTRTLFPRFSLLQWKECAPIAEQAVFSLAAITLPLTVATAIGMKPFLRLWIGAGFAEIAAPVGQLLLIGVWINSLAWVPLGLLQGQGRPAIVAKLHALELAPYVAILWIGMAWAGLPGAAWAWVLRVAIDALLMFWVSGLLTRVSFVLSIGNGIDHCGGANPAIYGGDADYTGHRSDCSIDRSGFLQRTGRIERSAPDADPRRPITIVAPGGNAEMTTDADGYAPARRLR